MVVLHPRACLVLVIPHPLISFSSLKKVLLSVECILEKCIINTRKPWLFVEIHASKAPLMVLRCLPCQDSCKHARLVLSRCLQACKLGDDVEMFACMQALLGDAKILVCMQALVMLSRCLEACKLGDVVILICMKALVMLPKRLQACSHLMPPKMLGACCCQPLSGHRIGPSLAAWSRACRYRPRF
uniref:Uncharacterized protein n=1 Tax=Cannabis sativa TaxID=3483 RepID=A0A803NSH3_CANSA